MNRSIFQIVNFINLILFSLLTVLLLMHNENLNCFSFRGINNNYLKEIQYKNIIFSCSENISNNNAKLALDLFLENKEKTNYNFSIVKYFELRNNILYPFKINSCYAHPNLFVGNYNNLFLNYQFSHNIVNKNFSLISNQDLFFDQRNQYICHKLYIYENNLIQLFLNQNSLINNNVLNNFNLENLNLGQEIKSNVLIQNYVNFNKDNFNNIINKSLNL